MTTAVEFEQQLLEAIKTKTDSNIGFEQKTDKDLDFGMSMSKITTAFSKPTLTMAVGVASSGVLSGLVASAVPHSLNVVAGIPAIITGLVGKVLMSGSTAKNFFDGVLISGIAQAISRFIPASFGQELSQEVKEKFKQENKPCNSIQEMRSDVAW